MSRLGLTRRWSAGAMALLLVIAIPLLARPSHRAGSRGSAISPLAAGQSLVYRLQYRDDVHSTSSGPIYNPEAAHRLQISLTARLRLDVLSVTSSPKAGRLTRLRATYESTNVHVHTDAYDAGAQALEKRYRNLQGTSFEFTLDAKGRVTHISGLDSSAADQHVQSAMRQWLGSISLPLGLSRSGIKPGHKWERVVPLIGSPLAGLAWRARSTYRDKEPCPPSPGAAPAIARQTCAVVVTRFQSVRHGSHNTPRAYRLNGLRSRGKWVAHGESISYLSLSTGLVTSSTASEQDDLNFTVSSRSGSSLHYAGKVASSSQITLLGFSRVVPHP